MSLGFKPRTAVALVALALVALSVLTVSVLYSQAYVANEQSDTVSVLNLATNVVTATIPVGENPKEVAVNSSTDTGVVANTKSDTALSLCAIRAIDFGTESDYTSCPQSTTLNSGAHGPDRTPASKGRFSRLAAPGPGR